MNYYSSSGNKIMIGHFPGQTKIQEKVLMEELSKRKFNKPGNVEFVCPFTKDLKDSAVLIKQLDDNNYTYHNSINEKNVAWLPQKKLFFVRESLEDVKSEYSLILDTNDVVILTDLDDIFDRFNEYKQEKPKLKALYNASIWMHPHIIVDDVEDRWKYAPFSYLNAGCCFGETEYLKQFYDECCELLEKDKFSITMSEQYYVRKAFDKHQDEVFFDYDCKIFQCWHKQEYKYETDKTTGEEKCILL